MNRGTGALQYENGAHTHSRLGGGLLPWAAPRRRTFRSRPRRSNMCRICSLYGAGFFYIPGHRHLHQVRRLSARRHHLQRRRPRRSGLEQRPRPGEPLSRLLRFPLAHGADGRYPYRDRIRRGPHLRPGRLPVPNFGSQQPAQSIGIADRASTRTCCPPRAAAMSRSNSSSSSSPASPSASPRRLTATPWNGFPGNINSNLLGGHNTDTGINNIQYTAEFGNGVSASDRPRRSDRLESHVRLQSGHPRARSAPTEPDRTPMPARTLPDIVGRIRVDQAWGLFQISAAAHLVNGSYNTLARGRGAEQPLRNQRPPRHQVGRFGDGGVADQEPADRRGRRHQDRRLATPRVPPST